MPISSGSTPAKAKLTSRIFGSSLSSAAVSSAASKQAVADKKHLRDVLTADSKITTQISADNIAKLFEPMAYQGASQALIDRLLASLDEG